MSNKSEQIATKIATAHLMRSVISIEHKDGWCVVSTSESANTSDSGGPQVRVNENQDAQFSWERYGVDWFSIGHVPAVAAIIKSA